MHGVVSAPEPEAVDVAAEVLKAGGNAVDAAVACALVQGVVDPPMSGIGGWGTMQVFSPPHQAHVCLDFYATAPAAARPDMWLSKLEGEARDGWGFLVKDHENEVGYRAIATPGTLAGLDAAHRQFGRLGWSELVQPAIDIARTGFPVRPNLFDFLVDEGSQGRAAPRDKMRFSPTGRQLYYRPNGSALPIGAIVRNPDLADTLERIARRGADDFYRGDLARRMAADIGDNGGFLSFEDLSSYRVVSRPPAVGTYRGHRIATNTPPGGGYALLLMLGILEEFDVATLAHNTPEYIRLLAEVMKHATSEKDRHLGDPDFVTVPVERFLAKEYARDAAGRIRRSDKFSVMRLDRHESLNTTHLSILDADGVAVSMTHSLGMVSGAVTAGLGFMFNGAMGVFDPRPGRPGSIAPGKRRYTSACPTMVFRDGLPSLVIGAPGGAHIANSVLQCLVNVLDFGMPADRAVNAPRISVTSDVVDVSNRIPRATQRQLEAWDYPVARDARSYAFAKVHAVGRDSDGSWTGGADPGSDGMVLVA